MSVKLNFNEETRSYEVIRYEKGERVKISYSENKYGDYAYLMANYSFNKLIESDSSKESSRLKNWYTENADSVTIHTYGKKSKQYHDIIVDKDLFHTDLINYYWWVEPDNNTYYAFATNDESDTSKIRMHCYIMGVKFNDSGNMVDHINGNGLDNRKENLRIADYHINNSNRKNSQYVKDGNINGIHREKNSFRVSCNDKSGKRHRASFSIEKLGEEQAFKAAINWRLEMEKKFGLR